MNEIIKIRIQNELDIVLAYKRAMQLAEYTGMNISSQTKFATAVSEICRNVLEHVGDGTIKYGIVDEGDLFLEATVSDRGRGITNLDEILQRKATNVYNKGNGIINSRKLVDQFTIESRFESGTKVRMKKKIPRVHPPINRSIIQGWKDYFQNEKSISPYEEIKKQNLQLLEVMEVLRMKNLEAEQQIEEIKRLNSDLDRFAYTVTHDLKAPLKNMEAMITMIEESLSIHDIQDAKESCQILKSQTLRMDKLIDGVLAYAREGRQKAVKEDVNVFELVCDVIKSIKVPAGFTIEANPKLPILYTEETPLNQVFSNLINNAIKHHDKEFGNIKVSFYKEKTVPVFYIEDDGPGIPESELHHIFKMFHHYKKTEESTGVGLSIVENIISQKGGKVWVESKGRGTKFLFTWPDKEILGSTASN